MNKDKIRAKIEEERNEILSEMADIAVLNPENREWEAVPEEMDEPEPDQNDMADRFEESESRVSVLEVLKARLSDLDKALDGLNKASFGKCEVCEGEIEADRLEANPAATTCKEHLND